LGVGFYCGCGAGDDWVIWTSYCIAHHGFTAIIRMKRKREGELERKLCREKREGDGVGRVTQ